MKKDKEKALNLLKQKTNGEIKMTYKEIANKTGYSRKQINRFLNEIEKKDINSLLIHGLSNKPSNNSAPPKEIEFIKNFKEKYPIITISQFRDIYHEDINLNRKNTRKTIILSYDIFLRHFLRQIIISLKILTLKILGNYKEF